MDLIIFGIALSIKKFIRWEDYLYLLLVARRKGDFPPNDFEYKKQKSGNHIEMNLMIKDESRHNHH